MHGRKTRAEMPISPSTHKGLILLCNNIKNNVFFHLSILNQNCFHANRVSVTCGERMVFFCPD